jgi:hypothetical protein
MIAEMACIFLAGGRVTPGEPLEMGFFRVLELICVFVCSSLQATPICRLIDGAV